MRVCVYILLIIHLISCNQSGVKEYPRYTDFPQEKKLIADLVSLDTALFRYPFRIAVRDSIAIVMDLHNPDYFFHAFSLPAWKHLVSFGQRGEAPNEMLSAETFQFISLDSIWALDANKMEITRWSIIPARSMASLDENIRLDKTLIRALDFSIMDSCFLIPDYLGECRFHQVSRTGKEVTQVGKIPTEDSYKEIALPALAQAWRSFINYNPKNGIWALVTQLGEVVEIHNLKDSTQYTVFGPNGEPQFQIAEERGIPMGIMGFSDVQVTDNYVYAVFHGRSFKDINKSYEEGIEPEDGGRWIYVFDLKGNPVRKYILDHAVYGIDVHEKEGIIYATDVNSDQPILKYTL